MRVMLSSADLRIHRRGPVCLACGNNQRFWIEGPQGEELVETLKLPEAQIHIVSCGRCRSRNSIVVGHIE